MRVLPRFAAVKPRFIGFAVVGTEREPALVDALLDDLFGSLRAALPRLRGAASTLGREMALAATYLRLLLPGRCGRLAVDVRVGADAEDFAFPPMVLLPLAHGIAAHDVVRVTFVLLHAAAVMPSAGVTPVAA